MIQILTKELLGCTKPTAKSKPGFRLMEHLRFVEQSPGRTVVEFVGTGDFSAQWFDRQRYEVDAGRDQRAAAVHADLQRGQRSVAAAQRLDLQAGAGGRDLRRSDRRRRSQVHHRRAEQLHRADQALRGRAGIQQGFGGLQRTVESADHRAAGGRGVQRAQEPHPPVAVPDGELRRGESDGGVGGGTNAGGEVSADD